MSNSIKGLTVAFEKDLREEAALEIAQAIQKLRNVAGVSLSVTNFDDYLNRTQVDLEWRDKLIALLQPSKDK